MTDDNPFKDFDGFNGARETADHDRAGLAPSGSFDVGDDVSLGSAFGAFATTVRRLGRAAGEER